jgi:hypothetical protein
MPSAAHRNSCCKVSLDALQLLLQLRCRLLRLLLLCLRVLHLLLQLCARLARFLQAVTAVQGQMVIIRLDSTYMTAEHCFIGISLATPAKPHVC